MEIQNAIVVLDKTIVAAVVAASGAIIAAVITATISFRSLSNQKKAESKLRQRQQQEAIYSDLLVSLQEVMNAKDPNDKFHNFQIQCIRCFAHGDNNVAFHTNEYFESMVESVNTGKLLTEDVHEGYQSAIINSIREAQGLNELSGVRMIKFKPK
jgi:hypothetical protein